MMRKETPSYTSVAPEAHGDVVGADSRRVSIGDRPSLHSPSVASTATVFQTTASGGCQVLAVARQRPA